MIRITICGCGAIGSQLAVHIATPDIHMTVIDDDRIEQANLATTAFHNYQIGVQKAVALSELVWRKSHCPAVPVTNTLTNDNRDWLLRGSALVIDCFDNPSARNLLHGLSVPVLHVGVSENRTGSITWDKHWRPIPDSWERGHNPVCTHQLGRPILRLTAAIAATVVENWLTTGTMNSLVVTESMNIVR